MAVWLENLFFFVLVFGFYVTDTAPKKNYVGVVGGQPARIEDFPYQVSLNFMGQSICGGTIIHERFILTAAHCSYYFEDASAYIVLVGTPDLDHGGRTYDVDSIIVHEKDDHAGDYDISIFKLKKKLALSERVGIAKLPTEQQNFKRGTVFNITGWGSTSYGGSISNVLLRSEVPFVDQNICIKDYEHLTDVNSRMFCAGTNGHDACTGDSGGPLSLNGVVVGVASRGKYCARKQYPTIYTDVYKFRGWIMDTITTNI